MNHHFSLIENAKFGTGGYAMIIIYFVSLDKPEFTEYAKKLSAKTDPASCFIMAWLLVMGKNTNVPENKKLMKFLRENCKRNNWDLTEWLKTQSKVSNRLKYIR